MSRTDAAGAGPGELAPDSISVVLPTRDRVGWLERALRSVAAQTLPPSEILVVDDGSSDGTAAMVAERFPAARCLEQPRRGVSAARNRGIRAARGAWLALLDSDDAWLPSKLERQLGELVRHPGHRVCHTNEIWIRSGRRVNPRRRHAKHGGRIFRHCLPRCAMSPSSILIHRTVFEELGLFDEELPVCEDYDLWLRITARLPVLLVDEPLVIKHGGHADQLSRLPGQDRYRIRALEKILGSGVLDEGDRRAALATLREKVLVYAAGARRRGRLAEAADYVERLERWTRKDPAVTGARVATSR